MKNGTVVLSVCLVFVLQMFSAMTAKAQSASGFDGPKWDKASSDVRLYFVLGYANGFEHGVNFAQSFKSIVDGKEVSKVPAPQDAREKLFLRYMPKTTEPASLPPTFDEAIDEMSLFYKDFRNAPVCWGDAFDIAELTLKGRAPSEDDLIPLRTEDAKEGCGQSMFGARH
jgi:hypothetical protein